MRIIVYRLLGLLGLGLIFCHLNASSVRESSSTDFMQPVSGRLQSNIIHTPDGMMQVRSNQDGLFISHPIPIPIPQPTPFLTVTPVWELDHFDPERVEFQIRFSKDGQSWTMWEVLEDSHDIPPSESLVINNMLFQDSSMNFFEFMVVFKQHIPSGNPVRVKHVRIDFFSPGNVMPYNPNNDFGEMNGPEGISRFAEADSTCGCPLPTHATRTDWNCPDGQNPSCPDPVYIPVTHLIVHHSAGSNTSSNWAATVLSIWNLHVFTNGWCDVGYNWLIDPDGVIYQGRGGEDNVRGAHFCGKNSGTMGVCLIGNYENTAPSMMAMESLRQLLAWKSCSSGLAPLGSGFHSSSGLTLSRISGHKDGCGTLCPGAQVYNQLATLRNNVQATMDTCVVISDNDDLFALHDFSVYPNPSNGQFHLTWEARTQAKGRLAIFNTVGQTVFEKQLTMGTGKHQIMLQEEFPADGMYHVQLRTQREIFSTKIWILK